MTPDAASPLLAQYQAELAYLRSAGAAFARAHPSVAAGLDLSQRGSADPHTERLIEAFAFLTARLQLLYAGHFPEIPAALLGILCPHLAAPVPSLAIAQFRPDPAQARSAQGLTLARGTQLFATTAEGVTCRFRTCYPVALWPIELLGVDLPPLAAYPFLARRPEVACVLRLRLAGAGGRSLAELRPPALRLCLLGERMTRFALFDLLATQLAGVALLAPEAAAPLALLPPERLRPVGFELDEAVLPDPQHGHAGYRLLQEYAQFPEKFLFFDLCGLDAVGAEAAALEVLFLLRAAPATRLALGRDSVQLGCTPIINLFPRISEPLRLDGTQVEYRLVADHRFAASTEIHSIASVRRVATDGGPGRVVPPLFGFDHAGEAAPEGGGALAGAMWVARRRPAAGPPPAGSDIALAFVDPALDPAQPADDVVFAHILCTNRGRAAALPAGARLQTETDAPLRDILCLTRPTPQADPPAGGETLWRLVSHLALNRLSLESGPDRLAALRELLLLHAGGSDAALAQQLRGLVGLSTRRVLRHVGGDAWRGFCRGIEVTLEVDAAHWTGGSAVLLGSVLDRFLGLYVGGDAVTELVLISRQREGVVHRWQPRAGDAPFL